MQTMDTKVDGRTFTHFDDLILHLFGHFCNDLFDTRGVNTSVLHELVQSETRYLTAYGIEGREGDCFGCIVHYDLYAGSGFECADVTSFTTDDTSFDFVILNVEDGDGTLSGCFRSHTLDRLDDDFLGFFVCLQTGIVHDLIDIGHSRSLRFILEGFHKLLFRFLGRHSGELLQLLLCLLVHLVHLLLLVVEGLLALLYCLRFLIYFVEGSLDLTLTLIELLLALVQTLFMLLNTFVLLTYCIVVLQFQGDKFLFCLNNLVFLDHLSFLCRFLE